MDILKRVILTGKNEPVINTIQFMSKNIEDKKNENGIISILNSLLADAKTRIFGLELINALFNQFSLDSITDNAFHWTKFCAGFTNEDAAEVKLTVLGKLIEVIGKSERLNKKFCSEYLPNITKSCLSNENETEISGTLICLRHCIKYYPGWFLSCKEEIERFLIRFIEKDSEKHAQEAAFTFHCFLQIGSPGQDGINYINNFRNGLTKLCNTVSYLFNFFPSYFGQTDDNEEMFTLSPFPPHSGENKIWEIIATRIINTLIFIKTLIQRKFPYEKQMIPKHIFTIFNRGFKQHCCIVDENTFLVQKQSFSLCRIQIRLFQMLQVYLIGNLTGALPFTYATVKVFLTILEKCKNCIYCSSNFGYKKQLYNTVTIFLQTGNAINNKHFQDVLVSFLLKDMDLNINSVTIQKNSNERSLGNNFTSSKKQCSLALQILKCLLKNYPLKITTSKWQEMVSSILRYLDNIPEYPESTIDNVIIVDVYKILSLLLKQEYTKHTPAIHSIICILNKGLNNINYKINKAAREGLDSIELISQSTISSLFIYDPLMHIFNTDDETNVSGNFNEENNEINIINDAGTSENCIKGNEDDLLEISNEESQQMELQQFSEKKIEEMGNSGVELPSDQVKEVQSCPKEQMDELKQPPSKKMKTDNDTFNQMISSFQDEIQ